MAEQSARQKGLTPEQTQRLLTLLLSVFEKRPPYLHFSGEALNMLHETFGNRLLRAIEEENVDKVLALWERDRSRFTRNIESSARRYPPFYEPYPPFGPFRTLDARAMDAVLAQCKRDKDDIDL